MDQLPSNHLRHAALSPIISFSAIRGAKNYHPSILSGVNRLPSHLNSDPVQFLTTLSRRNRGPLALLSILRKTSGKTSGKTALTLPFFWIISTALFVLLACATQCLARTSRHSHSTSSHSASGHSAGSRSSRHSPGHPFSHGSSGRHSRSGRAGRASHGREVAHHGRHHHVIAHHESKSRHAYPVGIFIKSPPSFDTSPLPEDTAREVASAFRHGTADSYPARTLVRAGLVQYHPLHGGIYWRREPVKYIVMHSTETGIPISAVHVIEGWSSMGMRHPGAQYVVDRDGTIFQAVDPDLATVHVNIFKTLPGINNDNSIGIEMNHTGSQNYPIAQRDSVIKLVGYLKHRYNIDEGNIITHRYAQQGDHTDPVNFDFDDFLATVNTFHNQAIAYRTGHLKDDARHWQREPEAKANTYLKPHREIGVPLPTPVEEKETSGEDAMSTPDVTAPTSSITAPGKKPANLPGKSEMPVELPVPEPSEADMTAPASATDAGAIKSGASSDTNGAGNKNKPVEMKVYPSSGGGQAPLPGSPPSQSP
jgi:hypothetical protein